ncbi:hypothetical protein [Azospirillum halopraeferens]|uniref:hypothetical protein n=1 Tax=Azospirillum halopraeferens TaxID=34010 RepID=UPI0012EB6A62|nr:hypothetical protein [Azospirillum halopraeferens]
MHMHTQKLWFATADPDTFELSADVPGWLVDECETLGFVTRSATPGGWRLTIAGYEAWRTSPAG